MPAVQVSPSASLTALFRQQQLLLTAVEDMLASREHQRKDVKERPLMPLHLGYRLMAVNINAVFSK